MRWEWNPLTISMKAIALGSLLFLTPDLLADGLAPHQPDGQTAAPLGGDFGYHKTAWRTWSQAIGSIPASGSATSRQTQTTASPFPVLQARTAQVLFTKRQPEPAPKAAVEQVKHIQSKAVQGQTTPLAATQLMPPKRTQPSELPPSIVQQGISALPLGPKEPQPVLVDWVPIRSSASPYNPQ